MKNTAKLLVAAALLLTTGIYAQNKTNPLLEARPKSGANYPSYYYLPEIESYYDVKSRKYIYVRDGKWITATSLPAKYKNYNVTKGRRVSISEKATPYKNFKIHKAKYQKVKKSKHNYTTKSRPGNSGNAPGHNKVRGKVVHSNKKQ